MSDERERERLIEIFRECLNDIDFGQSGDDTTDIIWHIKKLRGDAKAARAELAKLREACEDVPWMLERAAGLYAFEIADVGIDDNSEIRSWREQSQYLRAALESEAGE